ncbi:MAG: PQQ-like beta-propeller repeat protein [Akkermansiaceae bacterium]|nr:PQQ-like beta-propeller repeat protein [Akkermansiaceae bacterium]NNM28532.1 PQQ-like beta-propeller repeat protein [Akkermansiaceae bacterium]
MRTVLFLVVLAAVCRGDDWPQWLGERRDAVWREEGIRTDWGKEKPQIRWRAPVSWGYAGPAVADGRVYVPDFVVTEGEFQGGNQRGKVLKGRERIRCLDAGTGREIWTHDYPVTYTIAYPSGPRVTPTVQDGLVHFVGAMGNCRALDAATGELRWKHDFVSEYHTEPPRWGFAAHPLVHGDLVYHIVGGEGSIAVAFDKKSGEERWRALDADAQGYCPPTLIEHGGVEQLLIWYPAALASLNPATGRQYWAVSLKPRFAISNTMPRKLGSRLYVSGPGKVAAMIELNDARPDAKVLWRGTPKNAVNTLNSTPHLMDGVVYGVDAETSELRAVSMDDGRILWATTRPCLAPDAPPRARHGTAMLVHHEANGQFWIFSETGDLILAELSEEGYRELGRRRILEPTNEAYGRKIIWSQPAFAMKSCFARSDQEIVRVELAAGTSAR